MLGDALAKALSADLPSELAEGLVSEFVTMREDLASRTLGRSAPGRFVESLVQALQHLETGRYDAKPNVDEFLRGLESRPGLPDGLRVCAARVARAMYALRNKRSIAHKNDIDPSIYDLSLLHSSGQWILAELVRSATGIDMDTAGELIDQVQAPVGALFEDLGGKRLVLQVLPARDELLLLLHSHYPARLRVATILASLDRHGEKNVRNRLADLWKGKLVDGSAQSGYVLTQRGYETAAACVRRIVRSNQAEDPSD